MKDRNIVYIINAFSWFYKLMIKLCKGTLQDICVVTVNTKNLLLLDVLFVSCIVLYISEQHFVVTTVTGPM